MIALFLVTCYANSVWLHFIKPRLESSIYSNTYLMILMFFFRYLLQHIISWGLQSTDNSIDLSCRLSHPDSALIQCYRSRGILAYIGV